MSTNRCVFMLSSCLCSGVIPCGVRAVKSKAGREAGQVDKVADGFPGDTNASIKELDKVIFDSKTLSYRQQRFREVYRETEAQFDRELEYWIGLREEWENY